MCVCVCVCVCVDVCICMQMYEDEDVDVNMCVCVLYLFVAFKQLRPGAHRNAGRTGEYGGSPDYGCKTDAGEVCSYMAMVACVLTVY